MLFPSLYAYLLRLGFFAKIGQNHDLSKIVSHPYPKSFGLVWPRSASYVFGFYACKNEYKTIYKIIRMRININQNSY